MVPNPEPAQPTGPRTAAVVAGAGSWGLLLLLVLRLPPDGREHGNLGQFLGRFHPLLVHGPVALLLLVPLLEIAGLRPRWAHLRSAAGWILVLAAAASLAAALDGWLLAWSGGLRGRDVTRHMWGGVWLAAACGIAVLAHAERGRRRRAPGAYPLVLAFAVGLMVWTAHGGGSISHGDGYLTEKMPAALRGMLGLPLEIPRETGPKVAGEGIGALTPKGGPASVEASSAAYYRIHIAPLFARSCVSCHRPEKHKGGLRMDSFAQLMLGGDDGPAVVPGDPNRSELIRRLLLPASDDDSMPSDGDKPLAPEEIQMIEKWIAAGAKGG